jgi:glycolate oxidase iron-sulfur subunit
VNTRANTSLPQIPLAPEMYAKFNTCVHCGYCLTACPTYTETQNENDSPRGRILLMKAIVDQRLDATPTVLGHLEGCLICRSCETACPSGVDYNALIETVRPRVAEIARGRPAQSRMLTMLVRHLLPYPRRLAVGLFGLRIAQMFGLGGIVRSLSKLLPAPLPAMQEMLPRAALFEVGVPHYTAARGQRLGSVLLLQGCVGSQVSRKLNLACVSVLAHNGFDVYTLGTAEHCCGAMAAHANLPDDAQDHARQLVDQLSSWRGKGDAFGSPIAGCGAQLKELDHVLHGSISYHERAQKIVARMRDIHELLAEIDLLPPSVPIYKTVTFHDPCHLQHAQGIVSQPRKILGMIPGLKLIPLSEPDICRGAAGTYNLAQPEMAAALGKRKASRIADTGAQLVATANVGCQLQLAKHTGLPVVHVVELLAESYGR